MFYKPCNCDQIIQEREVIRVNINRISDLSQDLVNLADLQKASEEITPDQVNFVNEKRINLRHNIVDLKDGLRIHYNLGEEVLRPFISFSLLETLASRHRAVLKKLSEIESEILNLSPLGILFNSIYIKIEINSISIALHNLSSQENSLLTFSGICRNEEPA